MKKYKILIDLFESIQNFLQNNTNDFDDIKEVAKIKYQIAIEKNISESEIQWSRTNSMLVVNTILISAITLNFQKDSLIPPVIIIFLCLTGIVNCYLWYVMNKRGFIWINHWIKSANSLERKYLKDKALELNPILNGEELQKEKKLFLNSENTTNILIFIIFAIYILLIFTFYSTNTLLVL